MIDTLSNYPEDFQRIADKAVGTFRCAAPPKKTITINTTALSGDALLLSRGTERA